MVIFAVRLLASIFIMIMLVLVLEHEVLENIALLGSRRDRQQHTLKISDYPLLSADVTPLEVGGVTGDTLRFSDGDCCGVVEGGGGVEPPATPSPGPPAPLGL